MSGFRWLGWGGSAEVDDPEVGRAAPKDAAEPGEEASRRSTKKTANPDARSAVPSDPDPDSEIERLRTARLTPAEALAVLRRAKGTTREQAALESVMVLRRSRHAHAGLLREAAQLHVARGEPGKALRLLEGEKDLATLLLAADLHAELGEPARALALVERVLIRNWDMPGAQARLRRLRELLSGPVSEAPVSQAATLLRSEVDHAGLRVIGEAGRGGAASVFEAIDEALDRRVALKVYHRPQEQREQLLREARALAAFAGSGVASLYELDLPRGALWLEWMAGGSLRQCLKTNQLVPIPRFLMELARVTFRIHQAGSVHGDIKPGNILFRRGGELAIADFGLCSKVDTPPTGGSLGYLSPERLSGRPLQFDDDVFAVGRVLEDVLDNAGAGFEPDGQGAARGAGHVDKAVLAPLAEQLTAPSGVRPNDAASLLALLEGHAALKQSRG